MNLTEEQQNQIISYVYGDLSSEERLAFEKVMAADPAVRAEVDGLQATRQLVDEDMDQGETHGFDAPPAHLEAAILHAETIARTDEVRAAVGNAPERPVVGIWERFRIYLGGGGIVAAAAAAFLVHVQSQNAGPEPTLASLTAKTAESPVNEPVVADDPRKDVGFLEGRLVDDWVKPNEQPAAGAIQGSESKRRQQQDSKGSKSSKPSKRDAAFNLSVADTLAPLDQAPGKSASPPASELGTPASELGAREPSVAAAPVASAEIEEEEASRGYGRAAAQIKQPKTKTPAGVRGSGSKSNAPQLGSHGLKKAGADEAMVAKEDKPAAARSFAEKSAPSPEPAKVAKAGRAMMDTESRGPPQLTKKESSFLRKRRSSRALATGKKAKKREQDLNEMVRAREMNDENLTLATAERELAMGRPAEALSLFVELELRDPNGRVFGFLPTVGRMKSLLALNRCKDAERLFPKVQKGTLKEPGVNDAYWVMGQCAEKSKNHKKAIKYYAVLLNDSRYRDAARKKVEQVQKKLP
jgi:hypothetical protein